VQWRRSVINLGGPGLLLRPPLSLRQSSFLPFPLVDSPESLAQPTHQLPNILMQFMQSHRIAGHSSMAVKIWGSVRMARTSGVRTPIHPQDHRHCLSDLGLLPTVTLRLDFIRLKHRRTSQGAQRTRAPSPPPIRAKQYFSDNR